MKRTFLLLFGLAALVGLGFFWRHAAGWMVSGAAYSPLVYIRYALTAPEPEAMYWQPDAQLWDETYAYARATQQVLRGDLWGNTSAVYCGYLRDIKCPQGNPFYLDRLGPLVLGGFARLAGDVRGAFLLSDFVFPALLFLLAVAFTYQLAPRLEWAILAALLFIWFQWTDVATLIGLMLGAPTHGNLLFLRTPYPQLSMALFLGFLICLLHLLRAPRLWWVVLTGVLLALNFYAYVYSWTLALAFSGVLILWQGYAFLRGSKSGARTAVALIGAVTLGILLATPVWGGYLWASEVAHDTAARFGNEASRAPDLWRSLLLILILLPALIAPRVLTRAPSWANRYFWVAFWAAGLVTLNAQVLTGVRVQVEHWTEQYFEPLFIIYLIDLAYYALPNFINTRSAGFERASRAVILILFVVGMGQSMIRLTRAAIAQADATRDDPQFEQVIELLNAQPPDALVVTNDAYVNRVLQAYVPERFLEPIWIDPLSDKDLKQIQQLSANFFAKDKEAQASRFIDPRRVLLVVNRYRSESNEADGGFLLSNSDFQVRWLQAPN